MKIAFRHALPAEPALAWAELFSDAYGAAVARESGADMKNLGETEEGGRKVRRIRVTGKQPLPGFAQKALGVERLTYDQIEIYRPDEFQLDWKVVPAALADRVHAEGTYALVPHEGGCMRVIDGVIDVKIPLIGGRIEKALADELQKSYDKTALFAQRWLSERRS